MISRCPSRFFLAVLGFLVCSSAVASEAAHAWLAKMNDAARHLEYDGIFIYQHDNQLETMRILHKVENGSSRERLISLNGTPREIIRDSKEVRCYWPDMKSVVVEYRRADNKSFPALLPEQLGSLDQYYDLQLGGTDRIADRLAQLILVRPRDAYRYGYHLWADTQTGLLLKSDLVDTKGNVLEQFMFTQISIGTKIPEAALAPGVPGQGLVWYREGPNDNSSADAAMPKWIATRLPKGFHLSRQVTRRVALRDRLVEHLVYSDGLATVSVFIEKQDKNARPFMLGPSRMGAVHALGVRVDDYQITTVGEAPAETIALIGGSVTPAH
jgi:sigma-E factor negative regulatory protein RseB